ncbi:conserved domain protein [ [[Propionibacterium] namnetense SK182B-JCVI]|uniref:Conserved domain protein n=1 Tax=[Propionibacterium] namnetense SK182B-JCVI TaxID=1051006 RepID=F9NTZ3_9ACTN|nr:conserved domain protein [ [[Propionibacterium] namnetense SK182B-JCVI]
MRHQVGGNHPGWYGAGKVLRLATLDLGVHRQRLSYRRHDLAMIQLPQPTRTWSIYDASHIQFTQTAPPG